MEEIKKLAAHRKMQKDQKALEAGKEMIKKIQAGQKAGTPLSRADEIIPDCPNWEQRWEGESDEDFRERTSKSRTEWLTNRELEIDNRKQKLERWGTEEMKELGNGKPKNKTKQNKENVKRWGNEGTDTGLRIMP
jgi:hypothetical protein